MTNILARTGSSGSSSSSPGRQSSQSSLFENFASHAKELVRETTRQSSQEGLLAHVDKVSVHGSHRGKKEGALTMCILRVLLCCCCAKLT